MVDIREDIIERYQRGDTMAFKEIYEHTSRFIYNVIYKLVNHPQQAEDLTHDVYLKLFNARESYNGSVKFTTWAYRIAMNHALNTLKRHNVWLTKIKQVFFESPQYSTLDYYEEDIKSQQVQAILENLPQQFRIILILREFEGLSYEAIADILNIELGTVKSRLSRAKKEFKAYVQRHQVVFS
jgi:RNA polymerase sigma-70 factor, ECF subfamily